MEIQDKSTAFESLGVHPVLSYPKIEGSYEDTAETTHRKQNVFLDIATRRIDISQDSVKIKMPPMPKRVNFKLTPTSSDLKPCESPGPPSVRGRSNLKNLLPKLGSLYRTSSDIGKASCASDLPFPTPQEKTSIPRSASLTKIFTPRIGRTSSLPVTTNENPESAFSCAKGTQIHEAKVHIFRSQSDPLNKERPIGSIDSFIRVIPLPRVPRAKAGDVQILNTSELQKTDDLEADSEDIPEDDAVCRICMVELCEGRETLKMECSCRGELSLAHQDCAVKWFSIKGNRMCDVCKHEVQNLPVTLLRIQSTRATDSAATRVQSININDYRAWQEVPVLVIVSMLAYFCFLEQLLVAQMGTGAITISLPFSCLLGLLSSMTSSTMAQEQRHQQLSDLNSSMMSSMAMSVEKRGFPEKASGSRPNSFGRGASLHSQGRGSGFKKQNSYYCSHCKMSGHSLERCYKIHGYPQGYKQNTWRRNADSDTPHKRANLAQSEEMSPAQTEDNQLINAELTKAQYQKLLSMVKEDEELAIQKSEGTVSTAFMAVSKRFVWVYASIQFALVVIFGHIFYTLVHLQAIISIMLATFIGYGIAMSVSSIVVEFFRRRRRNSQPRAQQDSQVAPSNNQEEENSLCFSWLGFINHRSADAENP